MRAGAVGAVGTRSRTGRSVRPGANLAPCSFRRAPVRQLAGAPRRVLLREVVDHLLPPADELAAPGLAGAELLAGALQAGGEPAVTGGRVAAGGEFVRLA